MDQLGAKKYYFCHHCGSFHFPEPIEDGLRVLGRPREPLSCGICRQPLARALLDDAHEAEYCENCRGVLVPRAHFAEVVHRRRAWASSPPVIPEPLDRRELERVVRCPSCSRRMATHPYFGPGNVVIETCDPCDLIWLDYGELQRMVDAPGRDRGDRQQPAWLPDRQRRAAADADDRDEHQGFHAPFDPLRTLLDLLTG